MSDKKDPHLFRLNSVVAREHHSFALQSNDGSLTPSTRRNALLLHSDIPTLLSSSGASFKKKKKKPTRRRRSLHNSMKIQVLGAGLDVGRSCLLLTIASRHILLDCGAHHGFADKRRFPDFSSLPPETLSNIECILVTHFHFDHAAALPFLACNHNCKAPIYMTEPTSHLTSLMLHDFLSTSATRQHSCPFTESDVRTMLTRVKILDLEKPTQILTSTSSSSKDNSVTITAYQAGHTLGAVMLHVVGGGHSLLYSGDYSLRPDRVLRPVSLPHRLAPHLFVTEATYCSSVRFPTDDTENDMVAAVLHSLSRRGKVLFPVSAFGRVHAICASLSRLAPQFALHEVPAYVVSGTTTKALDIYNRFANDWMIQSCEENSQCIHCRTSSSLSTASQEVEANGLKSNGHSAAEHTQAESKSAANHETRDDGEAPSKKRKIETALEVNGSTNDSNGNAKQKDEVMGKENVNNNNKNSNRGKKRSRCMSSCTHSLLRNLRPFNRTQDWHVIDGPGPILLFATPANLSTGISRQVFQSWCTHPDNLVVMPSASFATSVAANSSNGSSAYNNSPQVRCKIVNSLSACHPDSSDILRICHHIEPKSIMLVHGEQTKVLAFRKRVEKVFGVPCYAPANGDTVSIPHHILSQQGAPDESSNANGVGDEGDKNCDSSRSKMKLQLPKALIQIAERHDISLNLPSTPSTA